MELHKIHLGVFPLSCTAMVPQGPGGREGSQPGTMWELLRCWQGVGSQLGPFQDPCSVPRALPSKGSVGKVGSDKGEWRETGEPSGVGVTEFSSFRDYTLIPAFTFGHVVPN